MAEVLVALTILTVVGTLAARVLVMAHREMDGAELELRSAIHLSELVEWGGSAASSALPAGPGHLRGGVSEVGWEVRYEPPSEGGGGAVDGGPGGFFRARRWLIEGAH